MDNENKTMTSRGVKILLFSLLLVAVAVTVIVLIVTSSNPTTTVTSSSSGSANKSSSGYISTSSNSSSVNDSASASGGNSSGTVPTVKEIVFIMPVENGTVAKDFTDTTIVWSETLGMFTGHMGMDIKGKENAKVLAAYDGEVTSITTTYLEGTTVVVNHGNGLESVYNSLEVDENLQVGDRVSQGDTLGVISTNNRQEYKDGAHLHFEVRENGVKISPNKYLLGVEK